MKQLVQRLNDLKIELHLSESARQFLGQKGYDPAYGARPLKRVIQKYIENPLSMEILQGNIAPDTRIEADLKGDELVFTAV